MRKLLLVAVVATIFVLQIAENNAYAIKTHTVKIPTGAADPNAPFFWDPTELTIQQSDFVEWGNGDTAAHTVTSGNPSMDAEDVGTIFDSGLFGPGKFFKYQFTETGTFDYFCIVHRWMIGKVNVVDVLTPDIKIIHNVGSEVDDMGDGFDVQYMLNKKLQSASVDTTRKTVTFVLEGKFDDTFTVMLPEGLIKNPNVVWLDNEQITNFQSETSNDITTLKIPLKIDTEEVIIMGTAVVPEFGLLSIAIFTIAIVGTMVVYTKTQRLGVRKI
ncbi:MAG TPA: plastocyanin/azurin family copper-binding protein [Nitrosopumilaceae archaeon]|nr:plastocyanin/azurin family copper-binding protein [Nitrosopumilaceae archaeon]